MADPRNERSQEFSSGMDQLAVMELSSLASFLFNGARHNLADKLTTTCPMV
jgi:hypothetical protein